MIPARGPSMWKRFLAGMVAIFALTATGSATAVLLEFDRLNGIVDAESRGALEVPELDIDPGGPQTLLLIGSDRRFEDAETRRKARSDTMILVRLNPDAGVTTILSLPRDLRTEFEDGRVDKLNYAYEAGGPRGVVRAVKDLMGPGFPINHVVNVSFGAFTRGVKRFGCFYIDVDRRYFNDNDPPTDSIDKYAEIDVQPGYQRMCGLDSLDFVRFRHLDTDFVRSARQQHYLGLAKDQVDFGRLFADRDELLRIFATYTDTDVKDLGARLRLLRLTAEAAQRPLRRIELEGEISSDLAYVRIADDEIERVREAFLAPKPVRERAAAPAGGGAGAGASGTTRRRTPSRGVASTLERAPELEETQPPGFPVARPAYLRRGSDVFNGSSSRGPRVYAIADRQGREHRAWRVTIDKDEPDDPGAFYGIQSTTWPDPPILRGPSAVQRRGGRELMLFRDGRKLRVVAWREAGAVHWVANTLQRSLSNREMLDIARTARVSP